MRVRTLQSGTYTFLFTDIESSTARIAAVGNERWAELQDTHRRLLREAFSAHDGVEVGTEGDAFFVAFSRAADALFAAVDGQRAIESYAWPDDTRVRVRIGLHTGEAVVRDRDYVGHDVHRAKRISDAGHGGQILLSQTTSDLVRELLPDGLEITSLGPHRFKDLGEPQPVFQVVAPDLQADFPVLRTLDAAPHNLPVQLTSFVGRTAELDEVRRLLGAHRLVTLTGVGGSGKTRLAIQAAADEIERSPDGVIFCDLSQISDEDAIPSTIARSLGVDKGEIVSIPDTETLRRFLSERRALLVLDNCEHLVDATASLVEDLLTSCRHLRILATSREALEVEGEHTWSVPSLEGAAEGAQLFAERAAAVRGSFTLTDDNADDVRAICQRLDGMPLAIELAAAQIGHLAPHQILQRLDDRFALLTGGRRRVQRQQTLQAAMDWSWDLLDERDRSLLARLTVFQGGCTIESVESVCGEGIDVSRGLRSLVGKSLVVAEDRGESVRYRLLETVRIFAEERLVASGAAESLRTKHRDYFQSWSEHYHSEYGPFRDVEGYRLLESEADNIRAALRWSERQGRNDLVAQLLAWTHPLWAFAHHAEGLRRMSSALDADLAPVDRGRILACIASPRAVTGGDVVGAAREALELLDDAPSPWLYLALIALANQCAIGGIATQNEQLGEEARTFAQRAAAVGDVLHERHGWGVLSQLTLGQVLMMQLRLAEAADAFSNCVRQSAGGPETTYLHVEGLSVVRHIRPDLWNEDLEALLREGRNRLLARRLRGGSLPGPGFFLALEHTEQGAVDDAYDHLAGVIEFLRGIASDLFMRVPITFSAAMAGVLSDWERAARLLAAAMQPGIILSAPGYALYRHWLPRVRAEIDANRARQLRDEGRSMSLDAALAYCLERP